MAGSRPECCEVAYQSERSETTFVISSHSPIPHGIEKKHQDPVPFPERLKKIFIEVSGFHSVCSLSNIKGSACQTMPFRLESIVTESSFHFVCARVCEQEVDLYTIYALTAFGWIEKAEKKYDYKNSE